MILLDLTLPMDCLLGLKTAFRTYYAHRFVLFTYHYFFYFSIPCGRLKLLVRQFFWLRIIAYRIVSHNLCVGEGNNAVWLTAARLGPPRRRHQQHRQQQHQQQPVSLTRLSRSQRSRTWRTSDVVTPRILTTRCAISGKHSPVFSVTCRPSYVVTQGLYCSRNLFTIQ